MAVHDSSGQFEVAGFAISLANRPSCRRWVGAGSLRTTRFLDREFDEVEHERTTLALAEEYLHDQRLETVDRTRHARVGRRRKNVGCAEW